MKDISFGMSGHLSVPADWTPIRDREGYVTHFTTPDGRVITPALSLSVSRDSATAFYHTEEELKHLGVTEPEYEFSNFYVTE